MNNEPTPSMQRPIWEPGADRIDRANLSRFMRFVRESTGNEDIRRYAPLYDFSVRHPEKFWSLVWEFCGIRATGDYDALAFKRPEDGKLGERFHAGGHIIALLRQGIHRRSP